jgi:chemotaxis response regulator CheB
MRRAIRRVMEDHSEVEVVGEAGGFGEAIHLARLLRPQVIVMDMHMPDHADHDLLGIKSHFRGAFLVGTSVWNVFLDKVSLGTELMPAILHLASRNRVAR